MSPTENPAQKCGIILFFTFFEGIHGLQASKARMFVCCSKETHIYKKKSSFLGDSDEGSWDFDQQAREKGWAMSQMHRCGNLFYKTMISMCPFLHWTCGSMMNNDVVAGTLCVLQDLYLEENFISNESINNLPKLPKQWKQSQLMKNLPYFLRVTYSSKRFHNYVDVKDY